MTAEGIGLTRAAYSKPCIDPNRRGSRSFVIPSEVEGSLTLDERLAARRNSERRLDFARHDKRGSE